MAVLTEEQQMFLYSEMFFAKTLVAQLFNTQVFILSLCAIFYCG